MYIICDDKIARNKSYISSPDCDPFYKVKPSFYFGLNQEAGGCHATLLGCGLKKMKDEEEKTWMIVRTRMEIGKIASWMDEYEVETWCQSGYRLYCPREVRAKDKNGNILFSSQSLWIIMDLKRMRPDRPSVLDNRLQYADPSIYFDAAFPLFPNECDFMYNSFPDKEITISYYDYDYNKHINNISYINWALDSFTPEFLDKYEPVFFDTEWKKQCHYEDRLHTITLKKDNNEFYTKIVKENDEVVFLMNSKWKEKN